MPFLLLLGSDIVQWLTKNLSIEDPGNFSCFLMFRFQGFFFKVIGPDFVFCCNGNAKTNIRPVQFQWLNRHKISDTFANILRILIIHFIAAGIRKQYENDNDSSLVENVFECMRNLLSVTQYKLFSDRIFQYTKNAQSYKKYILVLLPKVNLKFVHFYNILNGK